MVEAREARPQRGGRLARWRPLRWVIAVFCVLLGAAGGLFAGLSLPKHYVATTEILVVPTVSGSDTRVSGSALTNDVQIETEAQILASAQVADLASRKLGRRVTADALLAGVSVSIPSNSQVLLVSFGAGSPPAARDGATALADAYLERRKSAASAEIAEVVKQLETQLETAQSELAETAKKLATTTSVADRTLLESQRATHVATVSSLNARLSELRLRTPSGGQVISAAALPGAPTGLTPTVTAAAGLVVGLLAAAAVIVFWRQIMQRPWRSTEEGRTAPVLGALLDTAAAEGWQSPSDRHRIDAVRHEIDSFEGQHGPVVLMGLGDSRACARAAVSLAESWARLQGNRSVLVLADPDAVVLPVAGAEGLADVALERTHVGDAVQQVDGLRTNVIGPGVHQAGDAPELSRIDLIRAWLQLEQSFATVAVSVGSPLDRAAVQAAMTAGRIVLLVDAAASRSPGLAAALQELEWLGLADRLVGLVLVSTEASTGGALPTATARPAPDPNDPDLLAVSEDRGAVHDGR